MKNYLDEVRSRLDMAEESVNMKRDPEKLSSLKAERGAEGKRTEPQGPILWVKVKWSNTCITGVPGGRRMD